jgi:prepilin-type N-terminal cleavage/methylation domain-containing protein
MQKLKLKDRSGFTIIEIMIVLAIAGLIMLIVFLAVPALQRSARNTSRKNDAGNLASAISNFVSNNNGAAPGMETGTYVATTCTNTDMPSILKGVKLGYYTTSNIFCSSQVGVNPTVCGAVGNSCGTASSSPTEVGTEDIIYVPGATCSGNAATSQGASSRSYALVYAVESGSNTLTEQCIAG